MFTTAGLVLAGSTVVGGASAAYYWWWAGSPSNFGTDLKALPLAEDSGLPVVVDKILTWLDLNDAASMPAIFRESGVHTDILEIKEKLDKGEHVDFSGYEMRSVTGVLSHFLRDLPEFPFTEAAFPQLMTLEEAYTSNEDLSAWQFGMKSVVGALPDVNKTLLRHLFSYFHQVAQVQETCEHHEKMSAANIATVFTPSLVGSTSLASIEAQLKWLPFMQRTVLKCIEYEADIFRG